jgi:hypothetical protein
MAAAFCDPSFLPSSSYLLTKMETESWMLPLQKQITLPHPTNRGHKGLEYHNWMCLLQLVEKGLLNLLDI